MNYPRFACLCAAGLLVASAAVRLAGAPQTTQASSQQIEFFEAKIRPMLVNSCFDCHTADEKGGLRLDSRAGLIKGGESGPAIVPGNADASLLIRAVRHVQGVSKMPRNAPRLSDLEIGAFAEWITMGAPWPAAASTAMASPPAPSAATASSTPPPGAPASVATPERPIDPQLKEFWSFQPIRKVAVPQPANASWAKSDIDRFVLARLEREGMAPVGTADKRTLIRRATLDLTGLPATVEEIEAFEKDEAADAFAKVVDRLLASPRYGEHWGRLWLDVARYGEDDPRSLAPMRIGYAPYPNAYLYRDWAIKAFNDDLPYDQFVKAQIAADHLDEKTRMRHLPALGFLGLGPWYYDNGSVEITRADERHDRVDVVSRGFLGLTVACARCHDHKYDPISAKDYYAFSGVFLNTMYTEYPLAPQSVVDEYKAAEQRIKEKQRLLNDFQSTETTQLGETLALQAGRYMRAAWKVLGEPKEEEARVAAAEKLDYELFDRWVKFLVKPPKFYPHLSAWQQMIKEGGSAEEARQLADAFQELVLAVMFEQREVKSENDVIRAKAMVGTKRKERAHLPHEFVTNDDFCPGCGLELKSLPPDRMHLWVDVFQRDLRDPADAGADPADTGDGYDGGRPGLLYFAGWTLERWLGADRRRYIEDLRADIAAMRKGLPEKYAYVHGVRDIEKPVEQKLHIRGNPMREGDVVPRRFLPVLSADTPAPLTRGSGRLDLAEAILRQPITTRVVVNRVWKWHFGTGIVDTPSNFGKLGEAPSHPELLEHLAQSFIDGGYSIKALHRQIMLSRVYQLGASDSAVNFAKDAANRLYWRASRRRMSAEQIRDAILFVSGSLDARMGGPSVALTPTVTRRTVYGKVSRYKLDQYLQLFDFPAPTISAEQRFATNVPLQRLFFMNSEFVQQQAERIARSVLAEPDNATRITKIYRMLLGRAPNDSERQTAIAYLGAEPLRAYEERRAADETTKKDPAAAKKKPAAAGHEMAQGGMGQGMMAGVGGPAVPGDVARPLLPVTALGRYVRILLSSSEFIFID